MDPAAGCLISSRIMEVIPSCPDQHKKSGVFTAVTRAGPAYKQLLVTFQDVLNEGGELPEVTHRVEHYLPNQRQASVGEILPA